MVRYTIENNKYEGNRINYSSCESPKLTSTTLNTNVITWDKLVTKTRHTTSLDTIPGTTSTTRVDTTQTYKCEIYTFTATTMDDNIIVSLTDAGIDFNHITNFQLFMLLIGTGIKGADLLFENHIDFSSFVLKGEKEAPYLINKDGVIIDETIYNLLVLYISTINNIPTPKVTRVKDDPMQKQMAIKKV